MLDFIITYNTDIIIAVTFGGMLLMLFIEKKKPRRLMSKSQSVRWLNNISITLLNFFLMTYIMVAISSTSLIAAIQPETPFLHYLGLNPVAAIAVTILLMDFTSYLIHRLMHFAPWLWRLHAVHHYDTEVDVTTTHRHHPLESILVLIINLPLLIVLGPPILAIVLYNLLNVIVNTFSHSNVFIPESVDRWLRYFIVTPDFHRNHHVSQIRFTDSNYGAIFPWFDYFFGSATKLPFKRQETIKLGLKYFRKPVDSRIDNLLLKPFVWR